MCCQPDHIGPPPEWHRDHDDAVLEDYPRRTVLDDLSMWRALWAPPGPGPRPGSTEGGHGRALASMLVDRLEREEDWRAELARYPAGGGLEHPDWMRRPGRRGDKGL